MILWIKDKEDNKNFLMPERLGMKVERLENTEKIDKQVGELIEKEQATAYIITPEIAELCENCLEKYKKDENINIIITPKKA